MRRRANAQRVANTWSDKQGPIDLWTPAHFMGSMVLGVVEIPWWAMLGGSIAFEVLENTIAETAPVKRLVPEAGAETLINMIGDLAINMSGYAAGRALVAGGLVPSRRAARDKR